MTVPLHSSNAAVATLSTSSLTFTPMNWNVPQAVTVAGAVNPSAATATSYTVVTDPAVSADPSYQGRNALEVSLTNQPVNTRAALEAASAAERSGSRITTCTVSPCTA